MLQEGVKALTIILGFIILHELSHGVAAIIFGGQFRGMWITSYFGWGQKAEVDDFAIYAITTYNSTFTYRAVKAAGSLVAVSCAFLLARVAKKKREISIYIATHIVISYELFYVAISPLIKFGDAYQLLESFGTTNTQCIVWALTFFILLIFSYIYFLINLWRCLNGTRI